MHPLLKQYNLKNILTKGSNDSITYSLIKQLLQNRINNLTSLGYIALLNPNFSIILNTYIQSYTNLLNNDLTSTLRSLIDDHSNNIPILATAVLESPLQCFPNGKHHFLNNHLSDRILTLLIAQNFISIKDSGSPLLKIPTSPKSILQSSIDFVSTLTEINYADTINTIIKTHGDINSPFIYPSTHLEYILTEILKNAARASLEAKSGPINILIVKSLNNLSIRISDQANGIPSNILPHIWEFSFSTSLTKSAVSGMGYGLPLARTYTHLLGGNIDLHTIHGKGTHVYINIKQL